MNDLTGGVGYVEDILVSIQKKANCARKINIGHTCSLAAVTNENEWTHYHVCVYTTNRRQCLSMRNEFRIKKRLHCN